MADKLILVRRHLKNERDKLVEVINKEKETRDSAPSAMQSHHDTTRNQTEKLIAAYEEGLKKLENIISQIPKKVESKDKVSLWNYVEYKLGNQEAKVIIVPEGAGGKVINDITLISLVSPIGKTLMGMKKEEKITFNQLQGEIKLVS